MCLLIEHPRLHQSSPWSGAEVNLNKTWGAHTFPYLDSMQGQASHALLGTFHKIMNDIKVDTEYRLSIVV